MVKTEMQSNTKNLHIGLKFLQENDCFSTSMDRVIVRMSHMCTVMGIALQSQEKHHWKVKLDVFQKVED